MATLDLIHGGMRRNDLAGNGSIAKFLANVRNHIARRGLYSQTIRELDAMSDRDLADLGIARADIRRIAHEAAWGAK